MGFRIGGMKKRVLILAVAMIFGLSGACKEEDNNDDTINLLLLGAAYLSSGNCARVNRTTTYQVQLSGVPTGGCNLPTVLGATRAAGLEIFKSNLRLSKSYLDALPDCGTAANNYQTQIDAASETSFCASLSLGAAVCSTEDAWNTFVTERVRFFPVANGVAASLTSIRNSGGLAFTEAQLANARLAVRPAEGALVDAANLAIAVSPGACVTALRNTHANVLNSAFSNFTTANSHGGIPAADVTAPVVAASACVYGSGAAANNLCIEPKTEY